MLFSSEVGISKPILKAQKNEVKQETLSIFLETIPVSQNITSVHI